MVNERESETEAPFNMAIATLKRLDLILQEIRNLDFLYPRDSAEKQKSYISLVKQFYINAVPLFKNDEGKEKNKKKDIEGKEKGNVDLKTLQNEILNLKIDRKNIVKSGTQSTRYAFNETTEKRLNEILIEIQQRLSKFFMPGKRETERLI